MSSVLVYIIHTEVQNMVEVFQTYYCDLPYICGTPNIFQDGFCLNSSYVDYSKVLANPQATPEQLLKYPNFTFTFEDLKVTLMAVDYLEQFNLNGENVHCLGIQTGDDNSITILGDTFMKGNKVFYPLIESFSCGI